MGGEDAGQADNQVRRTAEMVDSLGGGYGVIAEGNVAGSACREIAYCQISPAGPKPTTASTAISRQVTYAACATRSELIR